MAEAGYPALACIGGSSYVIVYGLEDLLRRNQQGGHFPNGHFKVHLRELEESMHRKIISPIHPNIQTKHNHLPLRLRAV